MIFKETTKDAREEVLEYLKVNQFPRVLDIGGVMNPWAKDHVNHYFDIHNVHEYLKDSPLYEGPIKHATSFTGDINDHFGCANGLHISIL